jgi:hypothetical protein
MTRGCPELFNPPQKSISILGYLFRSLDYGRKFLVLDHLGSGFPPAPQGYGAATRIQGWASGVSVRFQVSAAPLAWHAASQIEKETF